MYSKTIEIINDTSFPLADANGNAVSFIDEAGNVQAHYTYDAFGGTVSQSGDMDDVFRFRFSSKYLDDATGLYFYGYRYFAPALGRWMNRDPIEEHGGRNIYIMVNNDFVNLIDFLGLETQDNQSKVNQIPEFVNCAGGALGDGTYVWPKEGAAMKDLATEMGFGDFEKVKSADECKKHCGKCKDAVVMYAPPDYPKGKDPFNDPYQNLATDGEGKKDQAGNSVFSVHFVKHYGKCGAVLDNIHFLIISQ